MSTPTTPSRPSHEASVNAIEQAETSARLRPWLSEILLTEPVLSHLVIRALQLSNLVETVGLDTSHEDWMLLVSPRFVAGLDEARLVAVMNHEIQHLRHALLAHAASA